MVIGPFQISQAKISLDLIYTSGKLKLFRKTSGTASVCDLVGDIFLFVGTGELPERGVKRKCAVEWTSFFSHKMCIIKVLTAHSH